VVIKVPCQPASARVIAMLLATVHMRIDYLTLEILIYVYIYIYIYVFSFSDLVWGSLTSLCYIQNMFWGQKQIVLSLYIFWFSIL